MSHLSDDQAEPPRRPDSLEPRQLGFRRRQPVRWLGPVLLAVTGVRVAFAEQFGAYLDKRELQYPFPSRIHDHSKPEEFWFDFLADTGDGFDTTYTMAYLMAQRELNIDGERLPRAHAVVLGGDQVYPTASSQAYEERFRGPLRAALPAVAAGEEQPILYALPGNHDWYDGLTAFLRVFARREGTNIGGWRTAQARSYFALKLPGNWWLFAIDAQADAYLDDPQLTYFREVARQLQPGDRVILCTPNPAWVEAAAHPTGYDTTDYFIRKVITPTGAEVALMLSGDLHHYARYSEQTADGRRARHSRDADQGRQLVTSGGGGAYLYATHELPERITVPPRSSLVRKASSSADYRLAATYPTKARSQWLGAGVFGRLPVRNWDFVLMLGVIQVLLLLALDSNHVGAPTPASFIMVAAILGLTLFFAVGLSAQRRRLRHYILGFAHGAAQVGLGAAGLYAWHRLSVSDMDWPVPLLAAMFGYGPVAAVVSAELVAAYLLIASRFGVNVNELFASQSIQGYKNFLRIRVRSDGSLTIYPVGVPKAGRRWRAQPDAPDDAPWLAPRRPLKPQFMEPPIHL